MLLETEYSMSPFQRVRMTLGVMGLVLAVPFLVSAQSGSGYVADGGEYAPAGNLPGDQVHPAVAVSANGGLVVWQDNNTEPNGLGISGQWLDPTFSPVFGHFRVNQTTTGDQELPQAALLANGGKIVVWQGGQQGFQHIYGAFFDTNNLLLNTNGDVEINTATNYQNNATVAGLANGNAIVTWGSWGQDNADGMQGVYAQIMSPSGQKIGGEFQVNQFTPNNQRTPAVAAFPNGNFIIAWVSEQERSSVAYANDGTVTQPHASVDIYARLYDPNGNPLTGEFLVNTDTNICANPAVAVASDNSFTIVWGEKNVVVPNNGWDIYSRHFTNPTNATAVQVVNTQLYGDQYGPTIASLGAEYLVAWTSVGQDGSREGVYAQFLQGANKAGAEFRVNTTTLNSQIHPAVTSDGAGRFLAVWSSYVNGTYGMDLMAQRYISTNEVLSAPAAPVVSPLDSYTLSVAWAPVAGFSVSYWDLYVDGSTTAVITTNTYWQNEGMGTYTNTYAPGSTHTFQLAYVLAGGQQSPLSAESSGQTWGPVGFTGLPMNWETNYYGPNSANWVNANTILTAGGLHATAEQVFLWGANPFNASTWLVTSLATGPDGVFLSWNTHPGYVYQVQTTVNVGAWSNVGAPRFAVGSSDSVYLGPEGGSPLVTSYRIVRVTY